MEKHAHQSLENKADKKGELTPWYKPRARQDEKEVLVHNRSIIGNFSNDDSAAEGDPGRKRIYIV